MSKFAYLSKMIFLMGIVYFVWENAQIPDSIKFVLITFCLFLFISPRTWFGLKTRIFKIFNRTEKPEILDKEKFNFLMMLIKLRYLELYNVYARLRYRQQEAGNENWILMYLKEEACRLSEIDYFSDGKERKIKKREKKAKKIFDNLFDFEKFSYDTDKTIEHAIDLEIEFSSSMALPKLIILRSFGYFQNELNELIRNYQFIDDTFQEGFSRFEDFIINRIGKAERRVAYRCIKSSWQSLFNILKVYLIYFEAQEGTKELYSSLFKEIEILEEMTSGLGFALRKKNDQKGCSIGSAKEETEKVFFEMYDSNSLWSKSFL